MQNILTFKTGADAFEYTTKFFSGGEIKQNDALYGLVTAYHPDQDGINDDEYTVKVSVLKKGFFKSGRENKLVDAIIHPDLNVEINVGDLILWGCADALAKPNPFGVIVKKFKLNLATDNQQFESVPNN